MIKRVLEIIREAKGPVSLAYVEHRLNDDMFKESNGDIYDLVDTFSVRDHIAKLENANLIEYSCGKYKYVGRESG